MKKKTVITQKKRGPLATGKGTLLGVRLQPPALADLDKWIGGHENTITRPEAVRRLVEHALASPPPHQKTAMAQLPEEPAGMERDNRGRAIPIKERLPEDRAVAKRAKKSRR